MCGACVCVCEEWKAEEDSDDERCVCVCEERNASNYVGKESGVARRACV